MNDKELIEMYIQRDKADADKQLEITNIIEEKLPSPVKKCGFRNGITGKECQFEIIAQMANTNVDDYNFGYPFVFGKKKYARILIRKLV